LEDQCTDALLVVDDQYGASTSREDALKRRVQLPGCERLGEEVGCAERGGVATSVSGGADDHRYTARRRALFQSREHIPATQLTGKSHVEADGVRTMLRNVRERLFARHGSDDRVVRLQQLVRQQR